MLILTILTSFVMFSVVLLLGIAVGYALGYKNDRTLKQQIGKLKATVRKHNRSAQLRQLTTAELKEREDWDMRARLAELTNTDVTTPDARKEEDPNAMSNLF